MAFTAGLATALAGFLTCLQGLAAFGGPTAGAHNFFRCGSLRTYDQETCDAVTALGSRIDTSAVESVWGAALDSELRRPPVWAHGDVSAANLLVTDGRLSAVIDFGSSGVGDPACDLVIAWTLLKGGAGTRSVAAAASTTTPGRGDAAGRSGRA